MRTESLSTGQGGEVNLAAIRLRLGYCCVDDSVNMNGFVFVFKTDSCAEINPVRMIRFLPDYGQLRQAFLQIADTPVEFAQFFLSINILGIFRSITLGSCCR